MADLKNILNRKGGIGSLLLIFFILLIAAGYTLWNNQDFQRANKKQITRLNYYLRDYHKAYKDFTKDFSGKVSEWRKSPPLFSKPAPEEKPLSQYTFEELLLDPETLSTKLPQHMIRHQADEITICSFDADFLMNDPLTNPEVIHLANIIRFCELNVITKVRNENILKRLSAVLQNLRYAPAIEMSAPMGEPGKTFTAFLYRNDKILLLDKPQLKNIPNVQRPALSAPFKAGTFDFIVAAFATPVDGAPLERVTHLEDFYDALMEENPATQDLMIFGDFLFDSRGIVWDRNSLLPTIAGAHSQKGSLFDLKGNFWFRKKDLNEFNGRSGTIPIDTKTFPSRDASDPSTAGRLPVWAQFKMLPDDD